MLSDNLIDSLTKCEKGGTFSLFSPYGECGHDKWHRLRKESAEFQKLQHPDKKPADSQNTDED